MKLLALLICVCLSGFAQKGGGSSRSYSSPSRSSSSSSSPSRSSAPSSPSRSYSSSPRSAPAAAPQRSGSAPSRSYGTPARPSTQSSPSRLYSSPSRSYSAPARTLGPPVYYGGRSYYPVPYYRPPLFYSHSYYYGYGDYVPWYAWAAIWHTNQQPVVINANGGAPQYYDAGQTSFNWLGLFVWILILSGVGWGIWAFMNRAPQRVYRHY